jgi:hypothetical protein
MISRSLAIGVLAAACVTAAAGGSYLAVRHNAESSTPAAAPAPAPAPAVNESEGLVTPPKGTESEAPAPVAEPVESPAPINPPPAERRVFPSKKAPARRALPARASVEPAPEPARVIPASVPVVESEPVPPSAPLPEPVVPAADPLPMERAPEPPAEPVFEEIYIPASSVIGLELDTTVTSERARIEDRVDARVTRDVFADGRLAIPAGSRVIGAVSLVERGGKVKERARLGVRFHTLVLANGRHVQLRTEPIYREGESPANESSKKIGGAAIGGAVLGAILGGKKGAIAGATAGAAGGTAAVMAGGRNPATLPIGTVVTVKLAAPVAFEVER